MNKIIGPIIKVPKTIGIDKTKICCGIDEAGCGSLISGCYVASCIMPVENPYPDNKYKTNLWNSINDSKKIAKNKRNLLFDFIKEVSIEWNITIIDEKEVDKINIRESRLQGFHRTLNELKTDFNMILVDGNIFDDYYKNNQKIEHLCVIEGDSKYRSIASASILAKVQRDRDMIKLHKEYPIYNWNKNFGYPTKLHLDLIKKHGITKYHRKTFGICKKWRELPQTYLK